MGTVIDSFSEKGQTRTALAISAAVIFILMVLHTLTMVFTVEKDSGVQERVNSLQSVKDVFANKNVLQIAILFVLYYISTYISTPFYGTYQIGELGLNLKFISVITMCGSISRLLVSKFWGGYADKRSFAAMIEKCFVFLAMGQLAVIFAIPETGKIMFVIYQIFHGVALGGINSALINLIFDYVPVDKRANSLAVTQAVAGVVGFMTTLLISPLVSYIQNNGNTLCGIRIYAQQFITVIAFVFTIISIIYIRKVVMKQVKPT
jgi:MFS family permease